MKKSRKTAYVVYEWSLTWRINHKMLCICRAGTLLELTVLVTIGNTAKLFILRKAIIEDPGSSKYTIMEA